MRPQAAAGRKRRGFKEGGLAYGEMTARGAQPDVAPSMGGVDPYTRGFKKNTEPSGALRRTTVHHDPERACEAAFPPRPRGTPSIQIPLKPPFHHTTALCVLNGAPGVGKGRDHS